MFKMQPTIFTIIKSTNTPIAAIIPLLIRSIIICFILFLFFKIVNKNTNAKIFLLFLDRTLFLKLLVLLIL